MVAEYPKVQSFKVDNPIQQRPGMAGRVALIGAFSKDFTDPILVNGVDEAYTEFGKDTTFDGVKCIEPLFKGASSILGVNITTRSGQTVEKDITTAKLTDALAKIKHEKFNTIYIAGLITDAFLPIITAFCDERRLNKMPVGFGYAINRSTLAEYTTTAGLFKDYSYGGVCGQQFTIGDADAPLSLMESGAYWTGLVSGLNVGNSMTKKIVDGVTAVTPEYNFEVVEEGYSGLNLLQLGLTTFECLDRENRQFVCVNSEQPNGLDLYINRVRDYVLTKMALHNYLGERNRPASIGQIEQELDRVKDECVNTLDLLSDIEYHVVKKDASCVDVYITKLLFAGIITEIDVYFTVEVE